MKKNYALFLIIVLISLSGCTKKVSFFGEPSDNTLLVIGYDPICKSENQGCYLGIFYPRSSHPFGPTIWELPDHPGLEIGKVVVVEDSKVVGIVDISKEQKEK
ncbi:hypothetical protein ACFLZ9_01645 [Patescibacteria group bacterium]